MSRTSLKYPLLLLVLSLWLVISVMLTPHQNGTSAQTNTHVVQAGDSLWKIAVQYEIGLSEIISVNSHLNNPNLIYADQVIQIPAIDHIKQIEDRVRQLTNQERAKHGLQPLQADWQVSRVARYKSKDMRDQRYFSHQSPIYGSPFQMLRDFNVSFRGAAENIAMGQSTAEQVVQGWMNSSGHRQNILNSNYTHLGIGYAQGGSGRYYWTQMFLLK